MTASIMFRERHTRTLRVDKFRTSGTCPNCVQALFTFSRYNNIVVSVGTAIPQPPHSTSPGVCNAYDRYSKVVQRSEGFRLHLARGRRKGLLRPPLGDSGQ